MNTAQKVRLHKEAHPEMYCSVPSCLWRTGGERGTPCRKHPVPAPIALVPADRERDEAQVLVGGRIVAIERPESIGFLTVCVEATNGVRYLAFVQRDAEGNGGGFLAVDVQ